MVLVKTIDWLLLIKRFVELRVKLSAQLSFFFLILGSLALSAQKQNSIWCFGDSAGIDFNETSNVTTFSTSLDSRGSCVSVADSTGQLLFYANTRATLPGNTTQVWNRNHQQMENGDSIVGRGWYNELIIIPRPEFSNQYYLFSVGATSIFGLYYSIIDVSENGGNGKVIQKNIQLHSYPAWDGIAAVNHANGRDRWLIGKDNRNGSIAHNLLTIYLITPFGITETQQGIGNPVLGNECNMVFSKSATKLLFTTWGGLIEVLDFNRCSGLFTNSQVISGVRGGGSAVTVGSAFSGNEDVLYITQNDTTSYLFQYDLTAPNIALTKDTLQVVSHPHNSGGLLRFAPDDKI